MNNNEPLTKEHIEQVIVNKKLTPIDTDKVNGYSFYQSQGNEFGKNIMGLKEGGIFIYVPVIFSEAKYGFDSQLERLKEYAKKF